MRGTYGAKNPHKCQKDIDLFERCAAPTTYQFILCEIWARAVCLNINNNFFAPMFAPKGFSPWFSRGFCAKSQKHVSGRRNVCSQNLHKMKRGQAPRRLLLLFVTFSFKKRKLGNKAVTETAGAEVLPHAPALQMERKEKTWKPYIKKGCHIVTTFFIFILKERSQFRVFCRLQDA